MIPTKVKCRHTGRTGWRFRYSNPLTGTRTNKVFWLSDKRDATGAFLAMLDSLEAQSLGLPSNEWLKLPYTELVERFLREAPISSPRRRKGLRLVLMRNPLKIRFASDLIIGRLNMAMRQTTVISEYSKLTLQSALKQMTRALAELGLFQYDPLGPWRKLPIVHEKKRRRAYTPAMIHEILQNADQFDREFARLNSTAFVIKLLLLTGNRPAAVFGAKVGDIDWEQSRLVLPRGNGNKRNGLCYLPTAFLPEVRAYLAGRGTVTPDQSLILSHRGAPGDPVNFAKDFTALLIYTFVKQAWPADDPRTVLINPLEVAYRIYHRCLRGFDGAPPTDPDKIRRRKERAQAVESLQAELAPVVAQQMHGHDMYALKTTHITWARRLSNYDSVRSQVGHAGQDVEEKYYLDMNLVNAKESPEAVWAVLTGLNSLVGGQGKLGAVAPEAALTVHRRTAGA